MPVHERLTVRSLGLLALASMLLASCGGSSAGGGDKAASQPASVSSSTSGSNPPPSNSGSVTITTNLLPNAQAAAPYGTVLLANGGATPYTWTISQGALPAGVSLNPATGQITGTPSAAGTATFTAMATDASPTPQKAALQLRIVVGPASTGTASLSTAPGWHKIPATALCGRGSENNAPYTDPDNFPNNLNSAYASYGFGFTTQCYNILEDSNSGAYDTTRHRLVLFGGGHEHYWGNDVFSLELTMVNTGAPAAMFHLDHSADPNGCPSSGSGMVKEASGASNGAICSYNSGGALSTVLGLPGCSYAPGCTPSQATTPASVHTYNTTVYIPGYDLMTEFGGATAPEGNASNNVWLLAMSSVLATCAPNATTNQQGCNPAWTAVGDPADNSAFNDGGNVGSTAAYDPNTQGVWMQNQNGLEWFNPADHTVTQKTSTGIGYHSTAVLDPTDKYLILIGPQSTSPIEGILYINVACADAPACTGSNFTIQRPATTGCANLIGGSNANPQYMGAQWDPVGNRVVIYPNTGNVIWYLDPATWTCSSEVYGATQGNDYPQDTPLPSGDAGTFGHFAYDPTFDVFVLCNDPYNDCWYLRPSR